MNPPPGEAMAQREALLEQAEKPWRKAQDQGEAIARLNELTASYPGIEPSIIKSGADGAKEFLEQQQRIINEQRDLIKIASLEAMDQTYKEKFSALNAKQQEEAGRLEILFNTGLNRTDRQRVIEKYSSNTRKLGSQDEADQILGLGNIPPQDRTTVEGVFKQYVNRERLKISINAGNIPAEKIRAARAIRNTGVQERATTVRNIDESQTTLDRAMENVGRLEPLIVEYSTSTGQPINPLESARNRGGIGKVVDLLQERIRDNVEKADGPAVAFLQAEQARLGMAVPNVVIEGTALNFHHYLSNRTTQAQNPDYEIQVAELLKQNSDMSYWQDTFKQRIAKEIEMINIRSERQDRVAAIGNAQVNREYVNNYLEMIEIHRTASLNRRNKRGN